MNILLTVFLTPAMFLGVTALTMTVDLPMANASVQDDYQRKLNDQANLKSQLAGVDSALAAKIIALNDLTDNQIPAARAAVDSAQQNADQAQSLAKATSDRLEAAKKDKADLEEKIKQTGIDYDDAKEGVAEQARSSFHGSDAANVMDVVTGSTTTKDFVDKMQSQAAVARSEANAASDAANTLGTSKNRKQRLAAIESQIETLKTQADEQAASAQKASEDARARQASLQTLRDQGATARASLEAQKSSLTSESARQALDLVSLKSQVDAANQMPSAPSYNPGNGSGQQGNAGNINNNPAPPSSGNSGGGGGGGGGNASGMNYEVPGGCWGVNGYCYGHPTGDSGNAYAYGQCTEWAYRRRHQLGLPAGSYMGNGGQWAATGRRLGYLVNNTPHVGAVLVVAPGQRIENWYADPQYGHVAVVEAVYDNSILISEGGTGFPGWWHQGPIYNPYDYQYVHY
ncbi:CHAP domain-containing protein [Bifidobacterium bohemicum]|nr:CHAP domain-containing protein [Bifidobacterium bohemicum]